MCYSYFWPLTCTLGLVHISRFRSPPRSRTQYKGVARGKWGKSPPPPKPKKCRKMVLFPKALFLVTNFQKNKNKKFNFYIELSSQIFKILSNFPTISVFRPNARKISAWFVKFFGKICLNNAFLAIFLRNFFEKFR